MKLKTLMAVVAVATAALSAHAGADAIQVQNAWARATVKGQQATGAFMTLTARDGAKLVAVASPVAGVAQVHEMKMDGGVMKMNELKAGLDLPAGKAVELKPGGYHVMLMDLKTTLLKDSSLPLTLVFKDAKGVESKVEIKVPVAASAPAAAVAGKDGMAEHMMHGNMPVKAAP